MFGREVTMKLKANAAAELTRIAESDIISLHCPLTESSHHLIDALSLARMKRGAMLINTGRGALIDTPALIGALKSGQLGYLGLDVYEEEAELFFEDCSDLPLQDDVLARLLSFPNVIVTAHQAFLTHEALAAIARTTLDNIAACAAGESAALLSASSSHCSIRPWSRSSTSSASRRSAATGRCGP